MTDNSVYISFYVHFVQFWNDYKIRIKISSLTMTFVIYNNDTWKEKKLLNEHLCRICNKEDHVVKI